MYGLPKDLDLSFFVGKTLDSITFAAVNVFFNFQDDIMITVMSSFQYQRKLDMDNLHIGSIQSVPVSNSALMSLIGLVVTVACGDDDGTLSLTFEDGQTLRILENKKPYEQYSFTDGKNEYVV